jgi:hypothetical protein
MSRRRKAVVAIGAALALALALWAWRFLEEKTAREGDLLEPPARDSALAPAGAVPGVRRSRLPAPLAAGMTAPVHEMLNVHVLTQADDSAVAGAEVACEPMSGRRDETMRASTSADGWARLASVPAGSYRLTIRHPRYLTLDVPIEVRDAESRAIEALLSAGGALRGVVLGVAGEAVPGAGVIVTRAFDPRPKKGAAASEIVKLDDDSARFPQRLTPAGDGTFELFGLVRGAVYRVEARAPGCIAAPSGGIETRCDESPLELRLARVVGFRLRFVDRQDGGEVRAPAGSTIGFHYDLDPRARALDDAADADPAAAIFAQPPSVPPPLRPLRFLTQEVGDATNAGLQAPALQRTLHLYACETTDRPPSTVRMSFDVAGYQPRSADVTLHELEKVMASEIAQEIALEPLPETFRCRLRLRAHEGEPVTKELNVRADPRGGQGGRIMYVAVPFRDGLSEPLRLLAGDYAIQVGDGRDPVAATIDARGTALQVIDVPYRAGGRIILAPLRADGSPVPDFSVDSIRGLSDSNRRIHLPAPEVAGGRAYDVDDCPPGRYEIVVRIPPARTERLEIDLPPGGTFRWPDPPQSRGTGR